MGLMAVLSSRQRAPDPKNNGSGARKATGCLRLNRQLMPKLKAELKPGTRVISYRFDMGNWKPDQSLTVNGQMIYLWRIP